MITKNTFALSAFAALAFSGAVSAQTIPAEAQTRPVATVPPGTQAVITPNHVQAVSGVNGVQTSASPGSLDAYGLPSIKGAQAGNVAGLTYYCLHNQLVLGTAPIVASRTLAKRPDVQNDQFYSLGGKGLLQTEGNSTFDITTLGKTKRVMLCNQLVKKAQVMGNSAVVGK
ncbi:hypothetical protein [Gluconobacter morbifer]|uniref:DUF2501 domain-containing protein n=1 Tax=Gluconobacter morbifer G707 TaxID=1088869 RepID=G6XJL7_9PROT|nr:hypothetical protein [Gluconobacter morbifer]EHH67829.1 hypothetical protein GMO_15960 [Gluconobacter morbifer G707]